MGILFKDLVKTSVTALGHNGILIFWQFSVIFFIQPWKSGKGKKKIFNICLYHQAFCFTSKNKYQNFLENDKDDL